MRVAEAGDGLRPIVPIAVGAALETADFGSIGDQARAFDAGDDFALEDGEGVWRKRLV